MNILLINHYAGSPRHGMEYRPYYLAREWVRGGHRVQIVAGSFSHVRSVQPALPQGGEHALDEVIDGVAYRFGQSGSPILAGTLAYVDCTLGEELTAGTHTIFLGNVIESGEREGSPLGYYDRHYRDFGER